MRELNQLERLRNAGFDRSYIIYNLFGHRGRRAWHVECSQCQAFVINGCAAHEYGCPNRRREGDKE